MRRRLAPPAGLALLLAGGALLVRVTVMTVSGTEGRSVWLFTAAACVLAGVALVLVALPTVTTTTAPPDDPGGAAEPSPELPRG